MSIHYNKKLKRFYDDKTGKIVSKARANKSSVARSEYKKALKPVKVKSVSKPKVKSKKEIKADQAARDRGFEVFDLTAREEREHLEHEKLDLKTKEGKIKDYIKNLMYEDWLEIDFENEDTY